MPDDAVHTTIETTAAAPSRRVYGPIALMVIACFGGWVMFNPGQGGLLSSASAQPAERPQPGEIGLVSASDQRKEVIAQLKAINSRLERVESMMTKGLSVKVTDMPVLKLPREDRPTREEK
ncbi:MAG: hypothetical protein JNK25_13865 [Phycisphaerae bacterium]|nr:hypothetical protein [Phycisphaerae bacterium]